MLSAFKLCIKLCIWRRVKLTHYNNILYKNKYWRETKFGKLANHHTITKFKSCQYFFHSISIVTLVAFEWFFQINISPNPLVQQIAKYYIRQYLFLYGSRDVQLNITRKTHDSLQSLFYNSNQMCTSWTSGFLKLLLSMMSVCMCVCLCVCSWGC